MKQADPSPTPSDAFALPTRRPWVVIALAAALLLISVLLIRTIQSDGSLKSMLPGEDSSSAAMSEIAESFDLANNVTLLVQADEGQPDDTAELIAFAQRFVSAFDSAEQEDDPPCRVRWNWPGDGERWTREVLLPNLVLYLDEEQQAVLKHRLTPQGMAERFEKNEKLAASPGLPGSAMSNLLKDPLGLYELISATYSDLSEAGGGRPGTPMLSPDGRALLIRIELIEPTHDSVEANAVVDRVNRAIDRAEAGGLRVDVGGGLAIASAAERSIRGDMIISSIGTCVLLQLLFLLTYQRLSLFPIAFLPAVVGVLLGFGVFALMGRALSPPTAVLGALLAGLGIDYAIHYLAHAGGAEPLPAVSRRMSRPLGIACVTSVIAFLTLIISDIAALRDFATIGAVGLGATLVTTLFLLPALLSVLTRQQATHAEPIAAPRWRIDRLIDLSIRRYRLGLSLSAFAVVTSLAILSTHSDGPVAYDSELGNMHPQPNAPLETQQRIADAFPGQGETLMLYLTAPTEAALLERAEHSSKRLQSDTKANAVVSGTLGIDDLLPTDAQRDQRRVFTESIDVQRVQRDFDQALTNSAFNPVAFAAYRETLADLLRPGDGPTLADLHRYPDLAAGLLPRGSEKTTGEDKYRAVSFVSISDPPQTREGRAAMIGSVRNALGDSPGVSLTGFTVVGHDIESKVRYELPLLLMIAGGLVIVWLALCYRNPRDLLFALLPAVLGLLITFALMRVLGIGLNLLNLVALPLLIGLGVDDGVLMVSIARSCRQEGKNRAALIQGLVRSAQAVTMTSITTSLAFGSLLLTAVPAIRGLGMVMAIGILACWALTVGLLAPLLVRYAPGMEDVSPDTEPTT